MPGLQTQGWTLVIPDYEGPYSEYGAGKIEGQITLDGIRAAENFKPLGLSTATPVGLWGYSGGAIATAWATTLQTSYAPDLNIVAVASDGTPADEIGTAKNFNHGLGNAVFSLGLSAALGVNRAYRQMVTPILNAKGHAAAESLKDGCDGQTSDGSPPPTGHYSDYTTSSHPFDTPGVLNTAPKIDLPQPGHWPVADAFVYQSTLDELVPVAGVDKMVQAWCEHGDTVHYYKSPAGEHITFAATAAPLALAYLISRFDGLPTVLPPGTQSCN